MQLEQKFIIKDIGCFYLANSRQMQLSADADKLDGVVFTLQTAGRCNKNTNDMESFIVVFTLQTAGRCNIQEA